jgi:hypothetical protein
VNGEFRDLVMPEQPRNKAARELDWAEFASLLCFVQFLGYLVRADASLAAHVEHGLLSFLCFALYGMRGNGFRFWRGVFVKRRMTGRRWETS